MSRRQQELNRALEAMHFGFRAMTYQPDRRLSELGLSRVHHRVLYFIARHPGSSVNELLEVMRVSKQYLHKPLQKMIALGYVEQSIDSDDRRVRRLALTQRGKKLEYGTAQQVEPRCRARNWNTNCQRFSGAASRQYSNSWDRRRKNSGTGSWRCSASSPNRNCPQARPPPSMTSGYPVTKRAESLQA